MDSNKKWWIGCGRDGWEEAEYPFSATPVFGWNPEEGYYGRIFTTDDDRQPAIDAMIRILSTDEIHEYEKGMDRMEN